MRNVLRALKGVHHVEVDLDEKIATVVYAANEIEPSLLIKTTTNVGYPSSIKVTEI
ncbi:MAG: hypothetical protein COA96_15315 [SAR86 cluster bacterium]|uniref:HMA domain-containing protein n=1 Tax=SAR86 cluster bacterium TaxID=2030880 RepID=A0A2A5AR50_9GAMM|nr:MAG: hypothetical protein COA96_15315 [SAR86 cluster bacterium]